MSTIHPLEEAIRLLGGVGALASILSVSGQAVRKWQRRGRLPRTEWTGETDYSRRIEQSTQGRVTRDQLLGSWPEAEREQEHAGGDAGAPAEKEAA